MKHEGHDRRATWVLAGFLVIALFFLLSEHRTHLLGIPPYVLLLACLLLHFLGHGGHGRRSSSTARGPHDTSTGGTE